MKTDKEIRLLNIKDLLVSDKYIIPLYQREFAWDEKHISQLFYDILGHASQTGDGNPQNYYLGILVVDKLENNGILEYETVDGQQRLTALHLLTNALKYQNGVDLDWYNQINLAFEHRPESEYTLEKIQVDDNNWKEKDVSAIVNAYKIAKQLVSKLDDGRIDEVQDSEITLEDFKHCLFHDVKILRAELPEETDLNHYFEVMNSRGEQLEKHEVLKAKMMKPLDDKSRSTFHAIWEACSSMDRYVQYGFDKNVREEIFGNDWDEFKVNSFKSIHEKIKKVRKQTSKESTRCKSLFEILDNPDTQKTEKDRRADDSDYHSVINFSNFLLHVLRIHTLEKDIPLDDNQLLNSFHAYKNDSSFVKEFAFNLLKLRFLFDKYVIKRDTQKEAWSLKYLQYYRGSKSRGYNKTFGDNALHSQVVILLAMFHVSTPTLGYKHWLNGVLYYLSRGWSENEDDFARQYINYLESQAKAFVFDRHTANNSKDYHTIIFKNEGKVQNKIDEINAEKFLSYHEIRNILVFNYMDYLIWKENKDKDTRIRKFNFTFRSSVEHYYPQNPVGNSPKLKDKYLHDFGNLCLVGHSQNSRLGNLMPKGKNDYYTRNALDSLKQYKMMNYQGEWDENAITTHGENMIKKLRAQLSG